MSTAQPRTRQRLSADDRREQLEIAAITVVAGDGFAAATAERISQAAGVSKGLLWHYFDDLDDLLGRAARRALTILESAVASDVDRDSSTTEVLRAAIRRAAALPSTHGVELRAVRRIAANLRAADGTLVLREDEYADLYERQAALLRRGQQAGDIRDDLDPHLLAVTYQSMVDAMLDHLDGHPELDAADYADHVATVLLGGIGRAR